MAAGVGAWEQDAADAAIVLALAAAPVLWAAAVYGLFGVAELRVGPEAVETTSPRGQTRRVERAALAGARTDGMRTLADDRSWVAIRGHGFSDEAWVDLVGTLSAWTRHLGRDSSAARGPTVELDRVGWQTVLFGCIGVMFLFFAGPRAFANGSWAEDPVRYVGLPLVGLVGIAAALRELRARVTRATFGPEAVRFESLIGPDRTVPYTDVRDLGADVVESSRGTIPVDGRNADLVLSRLGERVGPEQLSGRRTAERELLYLRRAPHATVVLALSAAVLLVRLPPHLADWWASVLVVVPFVVWGIFEAGVRLSVRRRSRHADD